MVAVGNNDGIGEAGLVAVVGFEHAVGDASHEDDGGCGFGGSVGSNEVGAGIAE